ncbi:hypothetical protein Cgig2_023771 [Carnegiea gigantea]|uniref:Uncharacterized protein n=1 Tax=Carnegiea gigantea TaxID=171969 RepID=A0A9Q1KEZ0_9CARY|nr:hypothetical protein Cgig2_023771 [Carnegiea gigantea]
MKLPSSQGEKGNEGGWLQSWISSRRNKARDHSPPSSLVPIMGKPIKQRALDKTMCIWKSRWSSPMPPNYPTTSILAEPIILLSWTTVLMEQFTGYFISNKRREKNSNELMNICQAQTKPLIICRVLQFQDHTHSQVKTRHAGVGSSEWPFRDSLAKKMRIP